eukprot:9479649-Pyramimonas_sp.AAC.2
MSPPYSRPFSFSSSVLARAPGGSGGAGVEGSGGQDPGTDLGVGPSGGGPLLLCQPQRTARGACLPPARKKNEQAPYITPYSRFTAVTPGKGGGACHSARSKPLHRQPARSPGRHGSECSSWDLLFLSLFLLRSRFR